MTTQFEKIGLFLIFLAGALLVFIVFSHFYPVFSGSTDWLGRGATGLFLLIAGLILRRDKRFDQYWQVPIALFIALVAISLDFYLDLNGLVLPVLGVELNSPAGWAVDKLGSSALLVGAILLLNRAFGNSLGDLYLRRGNLRVGLIIGAVAFVVMVASVIPVSETAFQGRDVTWQRILPWTPWIAIFVLANAFGEELLFRGLFFGKLQPHLGRFGTNIVIAIVFALMHAGVGYTADILMFLAILFPLSLAWGYVLQRTNSIWGSVLFHAAMDIPIIVGIFSTVP